MPVFARTKLVLQEDCYREKPERPYINYIGPNPAKVYEVAYQLIKDVFNASDSDIEEENYTWSKSGDKDKFKVRWFLHKDLDVFTYLYIRFDVSGEGSEKEGKVSIVIKPVMRTEYPQDTLWQRSLFYEILRTFWHRVFYHKKREEYAEECRYLCSFYQQKLKEAFQKLREQYG
ncbi:MAG TPA: hypothetical protein ENG42_02445 [Candidatus Aenigmarchaeota archaeon]|nr:MAG: hypothetical protein DRP03_02780 [Candidatus Aenigmarchaeota archaeon]HDD46308.1 hypothetical protein [Candidatus Aenigmarchaeota archaeon]